MAITFENLRSCQEEIEEHRQLMSSYNYVGKYIYIYLCFCEVKISS